MDHSRTNFPLPKVIVPVYPQPADMVSVKSDHDHIWHSEVRQVDLEHKRVKRLFLFKLYTGREIICGLQKQAYELWTALTSKVSLIFYQEFGIVQTGKNKSNSELAYQVLV